MSLQPLRSVWVLLSVWTTAECRPSSSTARCPTHRHMWYKPQLTPTSARDAFLLDNCETFNLRDSFLVLSTFVSIVVVVKPGMVIHIYNPNTCKTKARGWVQVQGQPELHSKPSQKRGGAGIHKSHDPKDSAAYRVAARTCTPSSFKTFLKESPHPLLSPSPWKQQMCLS